MSREGIKRGEGYHPDMAVTQEDHVPAAGSESGGMSSAPDIFHSPIASTTLKLSVPIMLSQLLMFAYTIVDMIFISMIDRTSTALLSGTGLVFPLYFIFLTIGTGLATGISSLVARGIGEKNQKVIDTTADSGLGLSLGIVLVTGLAGVLFGQDLIHLFAGSELTAETIRYAWEYFSYLLPGLAFLLIAHTFGGILQGEGLMKYIGIAIVISTLLNIILDPIMIFTLGLGVKGAALATSLAIGFSLSFYVYVFVSKKTVVPIQWSLFNVQKTIIREILRVGVPASLGMLSVSVAFMVLNNVVSSISQAAMNSWVLAGRIDQILFIPAISIAGTTIAMIGQNYGRGNLQRVQRIFLINLGLSLAICVSLAVIYVSLAPVIFRLFSAVPEVIAGSVRQVRILAFSTIGIAGGIVVGSSFQATGRPLPALLIVLIRMGLISIPLALLLVHFFHLEMLGVFIGLATGNLCSFILAFFWGRRHIQHLSVKKVHGQ